MILIMQFTNMIYVSEIILNVTQFILLIDLSFEIDICIWP